MFVWVIVAAVVGARALHVLSNLSFYEAEPAQVFAIWHGRPVVLRRHPLRRPDGHLADPPALPRARGRRSARHRGAPVLMAAWALGRLLGPQLMVAGGGHPTHQWFGMYYAGQAGKRLPVPIFQALEDFGIFCVLIALERRIRRWPDGTPRAGFPPGASSAPRWCSGEPSGSWTSTSGWARTATSAPSSCRRPGSRWW